MAEMVVVRQNINFETGFFAQEPTEGNGELRKVEDLHDLDPYGMLLASLGACTAIVINTYARYHGVPLKETELQVNYERTFKEDCERCEENERFKEQITMSVDFTGDLTGQQREKLFKISLQCPIHKMFKSGITVKSQLRKKVRS